MSKKIITDFEGKYGLIINMLLKISRSYILTKNTTWCDLAKIRAVGPTIVVWTL